MVPLSRRQLLVGGVGATGTGLVGLLAGELQRRRSVDRGGGVASVERRAAIEDGNENVEFVGDDTVRIVVARDGDGSPARTVTESCGDWVERQCEEQAAQAVADHLRERLGVYDRPQLVEVHAGKPIAPHLRPGVLVDYAVKTDRGRIEETPAVEYERLVDAAPRSATAVIEFDGRTHECTYPVWVQRVTESVAYAL